MAGVWDLDAFCNAEASSIVELITGLIDRKGDLARYVLGKPTKSNFPFYGTS